MILAIGRIFIQRSESLIFLNYLNICHLNLFCVWVLLRLILNLFIPDFNV